MITEEPINFKRTGKKWSVSIGLILASVIYAFYQNAIPLSSVTTFKNTSADDSSSGIAIQTPLPPATETTPPPEITPVVVPVKTPPKISPPQPKAGQPPAEIPKPTLPTPVGIPTQVGTKPAGQYADGSYTGDPADAYYGTIQVRAIIQNGALSDVQFLQHPNDRSTSVRINNYAMPILKQEAISAQNANVDIVSGATDTSYAFTQSLASALNQALLPGQALPAAAPTLNAAPSINPLRLRSQADD